MSRLFSAITHSLGRSRKNINTRSIKAVSLPIVFNRENSSEPQNCYKLGGYHPVVPGEVYNQRYKVIRKLGWGVYSTVWLVQDTKDQSLAALKILVGKAAEGHKWPDELGMLQILHSLRSEWQTYLPCDGGNEPQRSGLLSGSSWCHAFAQPLPLLKRVCKHVLSALQYLHDECGIIHTDIKGDNILMAGSPPLEKQSTIKLTEESLLSATYKLIDFGVANTVSNRFAGLIQPERLRSPEVIIGAEWDTQADIWNLGCLIYEFARGAQLFDPRWDNEHSGMDLAQTHLAQIVGLCGEFPLEFLVLRKRSHLYFDTEGRLLNGAGRYAITLGDLLGRASHPPKDIYDTAEFLSLMLTVNPKARWSAAQLLDHSWLKDVE